MADDGNLFLITINARDENIDLLMKGLRSAPVPKGRIYCLNVMTLSMHLVPTLREFCQLSKLSIFGCDLGDDNNLGILRQLIAPGSTLRKLDIFGSHFVPFLFGPSSLESLKLTMLVSKEINTKFLPHWNTNLKKLTISHEVLRSLYEADFIVKITSLTHLEISGHLYDSDLLLLADIVECHRTLEVLNVVERIDSDDSVADSTNMSLIMIIMIITNVSLIMIVSDTYKYSNILRTEWSMNMCHIPNYSL